MSKKKFTREIVLDAAYDLSKKIGLEALSMRMIAEKIGCSVMPIYEAFNSKEDLLNELSTYCLNETLFELRADQPVDRYVKLLEYGLKYPKFFLEFARFERSYDHTDETVKALCRLMKNDERLRMKSDKHVLRINARIETYIVGVIFFDHTDVYSEKDFLKFKDILIQVSNLLIEGMINQKI